MTDRQLLGAVVLVGLAMLDPHRVLFPELIWTASIFHDQPWFSGRIDLVIGRFALSVGMIACAGLQMAGLAS